MILSELFVWGIKENSKSSTVPTDCTELGQGISNWLVWKIGKVSKRFIVLCCNSLVSYSKRIFSNFGYFNSSEKKKPSQQVITKIKIEGNNIDEKNKPLNWLLLSCH
jgi:hypothetical protein